MSPNKKRPPSGLEKWGPKHVAAAAVLAALVGGLSTKGAWETSGASSGGNPQPTTSAPSRPGSAHHGHSSHNNHTPAAPQPSRELPKDPCPSPWGAGNQFECTGPNGQIYPKSNDGPVFNRVEGHSIQEDNTGQVVSLDPATHLGQLVFQGHQYAIYAHNNEVRSQLES